MDFAKESTHQIKDIIVEEGKSTYVLLNGSILRVTDDLSIVAKDDENSK